MCLITNVGGRGKGSGYKLIKKPGTISIYEIYRAFREPLNIIERLNLVISCNRRKHCSARKYWEDLNKTIKQHLENTNFKQLGEHERKLNRENEAIDYQI